VVINRAAAAIHRGDYAAAEAHLSPALDRAREAGADSVNILSENLALVALRRGNESKAQQLLSQGLANAATIGDPERISAYLANLAELALCRKHGSRTRRDEQEAEHYSMTGLAIARRIGNPERVVSHLLNLATLNRRRSQFNDAESALDEALALAKTTSYQWQISAVLNARGLLFHDRNELAAAAKAFAEAREIAEQIGSQDNLGLSLCGLAWCADDAAAKTELELRGRNILRRIEHRSVKNLQEVSSAAASSGRQTL
jgi:tetratricopeptide (TPR) repeat protein